MDQLQPLTLLYLWLTVQLGLRAHVGSAVGVLLLPSRWSLPCTLCTGPLAGSAGTASQSSRCWQCYPHRGSEPRSCRKGAWAQAAGTCRPHTARHRHFLETAGNGKRRITTQSYPLHLSLSNCCLPLCLAEIPYSVVWPMTQQVLTILRRHRAQSFRAGSQLPQRSLKCCRGSLLSTKQELCRAAANPL